MKVAILSMQQIKNYGSFLQAFSLKKNIESLGHTCEFINIIPGEQLEGYKTSCFYNIKLLFQRLWGWDFYKRFQTIFVFQNRFQKEFLPYLGVKKGINTKHYDVVVIGSDEVFNCTQKTWFGFSSQLFGKGLNASRIITYAASFGATTIDKLQLVGKKEIVSSLLHDLDAISVRDENSMKVIEELTGRTPWLHVDPVLMFDYNQFIPDKFNRNEYIIVYTYPGRITDKKEI
ncbi:polysaccharide pyruvyl transferase family protein, partial [Phocaeicola vulgatus]